MLILPVHRVLLTAALLVAVVRAVVVIVAPPETRDAPPVVTPELARLTLGLLMRSWFWENAFVSKCQQKHMAS